MAASSSRYCSANSSFLSSACAISSNFCVSSRFTPKEYWKYSKTCVRQPPLKLTLVVDVERWLSYKGTCHVILLAKLHDMYLYKTDNFFHINNCLKSVSKVALLHRFYCKMIPQGKKMCIFEHVHTLEMQMSWYTDKLVKVFAVYWRSLGFLAIHSAQQRLWSDCKDAWAVLCRDTRPNVHNLMLRL